MKKVILISFCIVSLFFVNSCGILFGFSDFNNVFSFSLMVSENNETIFYSYYMDEDSLIKSRTYFNGEFYSSEEITRVELTNELKAEVENQCKKIQKRFLSSINEPETIYSYDYGVIITSATGNTHALLGNGNPPKYILDLLSFFKDAFNETK